ncbi:Uma2 family endonuclease [Prochlorothrix hollandica]|uniref:Uma2 family endonuclease n=1 Tax=Prochlorothrix hollandica TaxID=1223 RepID=UPI0033424B59
MTIASDHYPHHRSETSVLPQHVSVPPTDLYSDEPALETYQHLQQLMYLLNSLEWWWRDRRDYFAAGNLTVYYSPRQSKAEHFRGPDFFVALDTPWHPRKSWVVWEEGGKYPNVVVEVLSNSTAATDRGLKKQIYQDIWRTPYYFWFEPDTLEFQGFHLVDGQYQAIEPDAAGRLWCQPLDLSLGLEGDKVRFFTASGTLVPTPTESALQAQQRADRLAEQLRQLGVDPDLRPDSSPDPSPTTP